MAKSRLRCCIVGCPNTPQSRTSNNERISFYSFPADSVYTPWKRHKRLLWVRAVKKYTKDPEKFQPKKATKICSVHFVGNAKSEHPQHPAYMPSIFPGQRKKKDEQSIARFKRFQNRQYQKTVPYQQSDISDDTFKDTATYVGAPKSKDAEDFCCQTDFCDHSDFCVGPILFCASEEKNGICTIGVQTKINFIDTVDKEIQVDIPIEKKLVKDSACDPIDANIYVPQCSGFHGLKSIKSDEQMSSLAGVSFRIFVLLANHLCSLRGHKLNHQTKLLITLMKLKTGLTFSALSVIFNISITTVQRTFIKTLQCLSTLTKNFIFWPSKQTVQATMPDSFKIHYPNTRVIIDCTEVKTEVPSSVKCQVLLYSQYKHNHTIKFLIGCTPNGLISFVSKCYGGRAGDCFITNDSGIIHLLEPGDEVLADKGFPSIRTDVEYKNAVLVMPPFLHDNQFSAEEVQETYDIASVRIHIERVIQRVKDFYIFNKIPNNLIPHINQIVFVVCALVNMENPIIRTTIEEPDFQLESESEYENLIM